MAILSTLARFSSHVMGSTYWTWLTNPPCVYRRCSWLFLTFSCRLKYIPYSDKIHVVIPIFNTEIELKWRNMVWNKYLSDNEARILDPADPGVERVLRMFVKIIRALSDGLRLKRACRVYANYNVPNRKLPEKHNGIVVPSRFGSKEIVSRGRFDNPMMKFLGMKYNTEHLEGLNWEVIVVESNKEVFAAYYGNGKIGLYDGMLSLSEEELAYVLAHEVGHGVAMHLQCYPHEALWLFPFIPWPSISEFWRTAIYIRLFELLFYRARRNELEADYIGLMLMASAGYDPRLAPQFHKRFEDESDDILLDITHPSGELRYQRLSQKHVMDRAIKIYEQVQAGQVPSIV